MIKWNKLSKFDGKLPVLGLTVEEAYIDFSFGSMLSEEEKSIILGGLSSTEGP